ncbi:hypothetical protein [Bifidobacterium avesanii]|uniref:histidine kinase n=1 Tax=Bifidobacterium avesanii TaxID=1798157 RepID=A0A7K3TFD4_9BIFI|nr:hypothetical protein [Bifidobacterium avesanii]KAB8295413.1 histidine kinase [Bifidobacterium avesanii]NEG77419.1 hypothetical protein [Bifidobacterium avesanii]
MSDHAAHPNADADASSNGRAGGDSHDPVAAHAGSGANGPDGNAAGTITSGRVADHPAVMAIAAGVGFTLVFAVASAITGTTTVPVLIMALAAGIAASLAYGHPLIADYANALLWAATCLLPPLAGGATLMAVPAAVTCMLAARRGTGHGMAIAAAQLMALAAGALLGIVQPAGGFAAMAVPFLLAAAPVAGLLMAWKRRLDRAQEAERELERRRRAMHEQEQRTAAATRIHDRVTNRLAYLILRIDGDQAAWSDRRPTPDGLQTELSDLAGIAQDVLDETRGVIGILNGDEPSMASDDETAMLRSHLGEVSGRLEALGFTVDAAVEGTLPRDCGLDALNALHDLIDEAGNNIAKHAEPRTPCGMRIVLDDARATLTARNRVRTMSSSSASLNAGTGLAAKTARIRELGGELHYAREGDTWTLRAIIPFRTSTAIPGADDALD